MPPKDKDSLFAGIDSISVQNPDGTFSPLTFNDSITLEPLDTSDWKEKYIPPKGTESISFEIKADRKTRRQLRRLMKQYKPLEIKWATIPILLRIKLFFIVTWGKLRHCPVLVTNKDETRAVLFKDINEVL